MTKYEKPYLKELAKRNIKMNNVRYFENSDIEDLEEANVDGSSTKDHAVRLYKAVDFWIPVRKSLWILLVELFRRTDICAKTLALMATIS